MRETILTIIMQVNFLVYRVNDIIDLKMIEDRQFVANLKKFSPIEVFNFVEKLFMTQ